MKETVKNSNNSKQEIISTATELFLENEYEKTTMEDITNKLGITKDAIYHFFNSKEELLDAVAANIVNEYFVTIKSALDRTQGNSLHRLHSFIIADRNIAKEQGETLKKLHRVGNQALHTRQLAILFTKMVPLIGQVIEEGCKEGLFQTKHPLESAELLLSIQFITDVGIYPWKDEDLLRRSKTLPALVEALLGASKGAFDFLLNSK